MNTEAIERIKGFCCEVDEEQWNELVRVADEVGLGFNPFILTAPFGEFGVFVHCGGSVITTYSKTYKELIPFPDFLAKLKGEEKWEPKAGEDVEANYGMGGNWRVSVFIGMDGDRFVCRERGDAAYSYRHFDKSDIRPIRPTITRTEAEQLLNKRIID
jgi:hypothetical protein